jgi:hypothetical protein
MPGVCQHRNLCAQVYSAILIDFDISTDVTRFCFESAQQCDSFWSFLDVLYPPISALLPLMKHIISFKSRQGLPTHEFWGFQRSCGMRTGVDGSLSSTLRLYFVFLYM